jgi:hypothetical protein
MFCQALAIIGAGGRNRTDTGLPPLDFESSASTNFTTPAFINNGNQLNKLSHYRRIPFTLSSKTAQSAA